MHAKVHDRTGQQVVYRSLGKPETKGFHEFIPRYCRLIVHSRRRSTVTDGWCKDNTSKDPFSRCKQLTRTSNTRNSQYMGTSMTTELMSRMRRATSTTTCLTRTQTWSMWTRTNTPTEDSWVPFVCLLCIVSFMSSSFDSLHITLRLKRPQVLNFMPCSSHRHRHVSCARWVTLSLRPLHPSLHHL